MIMGFMRSYSKWVENISEFVGKGASWLTVALMLSIGYEVIMRYGFRAPTLWSFDISYMLGGSLYLLGLAWVLKEDRNVRVDIISCRFSPKTQLYINILFTVLLFFPMAVMLLKISWERMIHSWRILEKASYTVWYPPIYPLRTLVFFAFLFWLLQGICTFYRNIEKLKGDRS
ncbi:MAG: TRAP transporter small permease subunit [Deltaproteobacteria bacterium]|nr:MAG: TRAP transporter small permease subunit [Deltaproteobacteria bacterium]